MDRRRGHYPRQEYVPPGTINFGEIDFGHDVVAQQMPQILQNYQQRWDAADAAEAGLLEQQGATRMTAADRASVEGLVGEKLEDIDRVTRDKYGGDRGAASGDIVKRLASANALVRQAEQGYQAYDEARKIYMQGAMTDNINRRYNPETKQFETVSFEKLVGDGSHFQDGQFTGIPDYTSSFRGAGDDKWFQNSILKPIMNQTVQGFPFNISDGKWASRIKQGMSADDFRDLMDSEEGDTITKAFLYNSPFAEEEFENFEDAKEYLTETGAASMRESGKLQLGNQTQPLESGDDTRTVRPSQSFVRNAETKNITKEVKRANKALEATQVLDNANRKLNILNSISDAGGVGGVMPTQPTNERGESRPYAWETLTQAERDRYERGEATQADLLKITLGNIATAIQKVQSPITALDESISSTRERNKAATERRKNIREGIFNIPERRVEASDIYGAATRQRTASLSVPERLEAVTLKPGTPEYIERSETLSLLWDEKEKYNLVLDKDGHITFDSISEKGTLLDNQKAQLDLISDAANAVAEEFNRGLPGVQKELNQAKTEVQEYVDAYPYVGVVAEHLQSTLPLEERGEALNMAIAAMANAQKRQAAAHDVIKPVESSNRNITEAARKNKRFTENLSNMLRRVDLTPTVVEQSIKRRDGRKLDDKRASEFIELVTDSKLEHVDVVPGAAELVIRFAGSPEQFHIDLADAGSTAFLPMDAITDVKKVVDFLKAGREFALPDEKYPAVELADITYQYEYTPEGESYIQGYTPDGIPISGADDGYFMNDFTDYLFQQIGNF